MLFVKAGGQARGQAKERLKLGQGSRWLDLELHVRQRKYRDGRVEELQLFSGVEPMAGASRSAANAETGLWRGSADRA